MPELPILRAQWLEEHGDDQYAVFKDSEGREYIYEDGYRRLYLPEELQPKSKTKKTN
jgi:hypothetical protein